MLNILYEDLDILVVDKPPGLVTTPSQTQQEKTLAEMLKLDFNINLERGGLVHRLDKDTSGALLVAKTPQALENLQNQFKDRRVKKEYLALVHGHIMEAGKVTGAVGRNPGNREKFTVLHTGKHAVTEYQPISNLSSEKSFAHFQSIFNDLNKIQMRKLEKMRYGEFTLLTCYPKTGRTHQIRVHLKYIGHPIVGDDKYVGRRRARLDKRWCPRQFLHAAKIAFSHPVSGKWMEVESPLPKDLEKVLSMLSS